MRKLVLLFVAGSVVATTLLLFGVDASLRDDVFTMVKQARKIVHTMFLLDTSEQMNAFAYSGYIKTCHDARLKVSTARDLCWASYHQCRDTENGAQCNVDLGCDDIASDCSEIDDAQSRIDTFCDTVEAKYPAPGLTETVTHPLTDPKSKKYIGPWDPSKNDYTLDLCFYDWASDTGGEVVNGTNSGHPSNNGAGQTDRRDWDCMTNGTGGAVTRSGLWLNWKYATNLDAMKIVLANAHNFAYPPRQRGVSTCVKTSYYPKNKDDAVTGQKTCYVADYLTATTAADKDRIKAIVQSNWANSKAEDAVTPLSACEAQGASPDAFEPFVPAALTCNAGDPGCTCDICKDTNNITVPCETYGEDSTTANSDSQTISLSTSVKMYCCATFKCTTPACRDDDACDHDASNPCSLGDYSEFDQDQGHCCDDLVCEETKPASDCSSGGAQFVPGPDANRTITDTADFTMDPLGSGESYSSVALTVTVNTLTLTGHFSTDTDKGGAYIQVFSGCKGGDINNLIVSKRYTADASGDVLISAKDLTGCDDVGYAVRAVLTLTHDGDPSGLDSTTSMSEAQAQADIDFQVNYARSSTQKLEVIKRTEPSFFKHAIETDPSSTVVVNEYECRTTTYSRQSYVRHGRPSGCNYRNILKPDGTPYTECYYPDHKVIAKSWGKPKRTLCSWLCAQEPEYSDAWACKEFFEQMDSDTRNGPGDAAITCGDSNTLEECCHSVNDHFVNHSPAYRTFTPCQNVQFSGGTYKCCMAGFQQGQRNGDYFFTGGNQTEILTGHIQEASGGSYRLNDAAYVSPYEGDAWYAPNSLIGKSDSFISSSYISLFRTATTASERATACVYDIATDAYGDECDPSCSGGGCCEVSINTGVEWCAYPTFWVKIPMSEGGHLVLPAAHLTGANRQLFQDTIKNFSGVGGSTLAETLYDMWRYIGGMEPLHDDLSQVTPPAASSTYESPIQADPDCFENNAIIISGGQPQFDSNASIKTAAGGGAPDNLHKPYVEEDPSDPSGSGTATGEPKRYIHNFYLSALAPSAMPATFPDGGAVDRTGGVAEFVHVVDAFNSDLSCRQDTANNLYGFSGTCLSNDSTGLNVIDSVNTVAVGAWALGPLYAANNSGYLDNGIMQQAAMEGGGEYYGLTVGTPSASGTNKTFSDLTDLFNTMDDGTRLVISAGMAHFTSSFIQPFVDREKTFGPESYLPAALPVDNSISRFWLGNLKKYYFNAHPSSTCYVTNDNGTGWEEFKHDQMLGDCFTPGSNAAVDDSIKRAFNSGAYLKLEAQLTSCSSSPCFAGNTSRTIYYDHSNTLKKISDVTVGDSEYNWLGTQMALANVANDTKNVLDYLYGYDVYDDDGDGDSVDKRDAFVDVADPNQIDFTSSPPTITIKMSILGAIVHSHPIAVHYGGTYSTRIYFGAADGMLHSFDQDGNEAWAYMPSAVLPKMSFIDDSAAGIKYVSTVDGPIAFFHLDNPAGPNGIVDSGEEAYLIFGYRRGAHTYTVLNVTDPDAPEFVQNIAIDGQSWGKPLLFTRGGTHYMAITGGYDDCFDADVPMTCPNPIGNYISIYRFDESAHHFVAVKTYNKLTTGGQIQNADWLVAPFAADPVKVNITEDDSSDADFLYFVDISGTVFRIDTRDASPNNWKFRVAFKNRPDPPIPSAIWTAGFRSYFSFAQFPPEKQYMTGSNDGGTTIVMPIPLATGNVVNPNIAAEPNKVYVFYDPVDADCTSGNNSAIEFADLEHITSLGAHDGSTFISGKDGWFFLLNSSNSEKVISRPLIYFDADDTDEWYIAWNTFEPASFGHCKDAGTSYAYFRMLANGTDVDNTGKWDNMAGNDRTYMGEGKPSDVTTIGSSKTGSLISMTTEQKVFTQQGFELLISAPASILKWYELY